MDRTLAVNGRMAAAVCLCGGFCSARFLLRGRADLLDGISGVGAEDDGAAAGLERVRHPAHDLPRSADAPTHANATAGPAAWKRLGQPAKRPSGQVAKRLGHLSRAHLAHGAWG
jgi:hypothetical protein